MTDVSIPEADPLLASVNKAHLALVRIVGDALTETGQWPVYQYVEARMDDLDLDANAVLRSMPSISAGQLNYSLVRRGHSIAAETPVKLTIAGFALLPEHAGTVKMFLAVLGELARLRAAAAYDPRQVIEVSVSGADLIRDLGLQDEPLVRLLPDILGGEPSTWHGGDNVDGDEWKPKASTFVRRFADVNEVGGYLHRLRAWIEPDNLPAQPVVVSPLGVATALDYLDVVWRLAFGAGLLVVPSVERAARLVFGVATAEEFDNRLSAVGEMFKGFDVPGDERQGTLRRLQAFLGNRLTTEAMARVDPGLGHAAERYPHPQRRPAHGRRHRCCHRVAVPGVDVPDQRLLVRVADRSDACSASPRRDP